MAISKMNETTFLSRGKLELREVFQGFFPNIVAGITINRGMGYEVASAEINTQVKHESVCTLFTFNYKVSK